MTALECPHCHSLVIFPTDMAGKSGPCPNCCREIQVPTEGSSEEELRDYLRRLTGSSDESPPP